MRCVKKLILWILCICLVLPSAVGVQLTVKAEEKADARKAFDAYVKKFVVDRGSYCEVTNISGFWAEAEIREMFIDAYERFGDEETKTLMVKTVDGWLHKHKTDWQSNDYNDDIMWAVIMCTRTYLHTGVQKYLDTAKSNFDQCYDRAWTDTLGGGLVWKQGNKTKNACVNGPGAIAACLLGQATDDNSYYEKARKIVSWMNDTLVQEDGSIWDSINWENNNINTWVSTYNQGTYIGACTLLYAHYGEKEYFEKANQAAKRAVRLGAILNREQDNADLIGFKGILARWMGRFVLEFGVEDYNEWMQNNADAAWANRNSDDLMWTQFGEKTMENIENSQDPVEGGSIEEGGHQISGYASWGCSAPLSWLINCTEMQEPLDNKKVVDEVKAAIDKIGTVTLDSKDDIQSAMDKYDALSEKQKEMVTNYEDLERAEIKYIELLKAETDKNKAGEVDSLISRIGEVTLDRADCIAEARAAYDALKEEQKDLVQNMQILLDAENKIKELQNSLENTDNPPQIDDTPKKQPTVGTILPDPKTNEKYKVLSINGSTGTVEYAEPANKNVTSVYISAAVTIDNISYKITGVAKNAFNNYEKLTKVVVGSNVETIGENAFTRCTKLKSVIIGKNVKEIGKKAFYGDKKLSKITIKTSKLTSKNVGAKAFAKTAKKAKVKVPKKQLEAYKTLLVKKGISKNASIKK